MIPVLLLASIAALFATLLYAQRASVTLTALATLLVGYVLGHAFWHLRVGPLPLTLDRLMLGGLFALVAWRWWIGSFRLTNLRIGGIEWGIVALLTWLTLSALTARPDESVNLPSSPFWRLLFSFWIPSLLFFVLRASQERDRNYVLLLGGLALLGGYLTFTAFAESAQLWALVFPRYISVPELGLHYGRARGPMLNSVSIGFHLTVCMGAVWLLWPRAPHWIKPLLLAMLPAMLLAIYLTYTRSIYLGVITSGVAVLAAQTPRQHRRKALACVLALGVVAGPVMVSKLLFLEREDSGNVSRHSVQQRTAFAYISWHMFCDHPLLGVGFGRFYDQKMPYLSDRSQSFELESIRGLHHHNTLLSILTETGLPGLVLYLGLLAALIIACWQLSTATQASDISRRMGLLGLGTLMAYLPSAVFHDLSLLHCEQWLVMLTAGVALGHHRRIGMPVPYEATPNPTLWPAEVAVPAS